MSTRLRFLGAAGYEIVGPEQRIYHFGDSASFSDMKLIGELYEPTVGLIGCTHPKQLAEPVLAGPGSLVTGEMSPAEGALAAEFLGVDIAIATHYLDEGDPEVAEFLRLVPEKDSTGRREALAPAAGDTIILDGGTATIEV